MTETLPTKTALGAPGVDSNPAVQALVPARLDAIEPMPEAAA